MIYKIGITTGDSDGIGYEVTAKALHAIGPQTNFRFYIWRSTTSTKTLRKKITQKFKVITVSTWAEAQLVPVSTRSTLVEIVDPRSPARWVEEVAGACKSGTLSAMATAPLSKQAVQAAGLSEIGHTDILKRVSGEKSAFMGFVGKHFNVILATGHIPLCAVPQALTPAALLGAFQAAKQLGQLLGRPQSQRPIGLLGLNPHSGDQGLIGSEEQVLFPTTLTAAKELGFRVAGPLVPDAAFHKSNWKRYLTFVACYHDQGLIPFKTVHGHESGVHLTLGLGIKRTSVDHGTAKDIFGKNKADPRSMIEAIRWAQRWAATTKR